MGDILMSNVYDALEKNIINQTQALYIIGLSYSIEYPIESEDLINLVKLKYIQAGKIGRLILTQEKAISGLSGTIAPIYTTEMSREIVVRMCNLFCNKDPKTNTLILPGNNGDIHHTAKNYLGGEGLIAHHYIIFLFLFPIRGKTNKKWEKWFLGAPYKGARLRLRTSSNALKFKNMAKSKDMGIFLYGTYLFIQAGIQGDKTFIKAIDKYFTEYREWYDIAEEEIKGTRSVDDLFKRKALREGRTNIAI